MDLLLCCFGASRGFLVHSVNDIKRNKNAIDNNHDSVEILNDDCL